MAPPATESHGSLRERQVRDLAARLGVADFLYHAPPTAKGRAVREAAGDGLLIAGGRGAVLQVKARDPAIAVVDSPERGAAWVRKNAHHAADQGAGARREMARLAKTGTPLVVSPVRASDLEPEIRAKYALKVDSNVSSWPTIVVVDHPAADGIDLGFRPTVLWVTLADWAALQRRLRSVSVTLGYFDRVLSDGLHVPLGCEQARYRALYAEDEQWVVEGGPTAVPYLADPDEFDEVGVDLYHDLIENVWRHDGVIPWKQASDYREIVEFLDQVPPTTQATIGRWVLRKRTEIAGGRRRSSGIARASGERLVYSCTHARHWSDQKEWGAELTSLATVRHIQAMESGADPDSRTLAVGVWVEDRPPGTGVVYVYVFVSGKHRFPSDLRRWVEWRYGVYNERRGGVQAVVVGKKEPCPCGSKKRYGRCSGSGAR